jgi:WS/DGAT/MGAT family acyltransferase
MHLGALLQFGPGGSAGPAALAVLLAGRAARAPRLRQRVHVPRNPLESPRWVEDRAFDALRHVRVHGLAGRGAVERVTAELMATPLRRDRAPWEIHLLTDGHPERGFRLLLKLHHAAADGLRAVELGVRLLDRLERSSTRRAATGSADCDMSGSAEGPELPVPAYGEWRVPAPWARMEEVARRTVRSADVLADVAAGVGLRLGESLRPRLLGTVRGPLDHPLHTASSAGPGTRVVALAALPTAELQTLRRWFGGTLHDVSLALISGALRRWYLELGVDPARRRTQVLVPVGRRPRAGDAALGNQLSGYLVTLPVGEPDPVTRLLRMRQVLDEHKGRGAEQGAGALPLLSDLVPPGVHRLAGPLLAPTAPLLFDALVSDVPIPGLPFTLVGAPLRAVHPLAPLARGHALALAVSRYRGQVNIGVHGLADDLRDPRGLERALRTELDDLLAHVAAPSGAAA